MIIDQLPLLGGDVQGTDEFPIERGTTTYKTTQAALIKAATDAADEANAKGLPPGGTAGQVLTKAGSADYSASWEDPSGGGDVTADMLGIVINGNSTPVGASADQYVIVKNSTISGITDGLYKAAQEIPANTAIDSTYLTTSSNGGLNDMRRVADLKIVWGSYGPAFNIGAMVAMNAAQYLPAVQLPDGYSPIFYWLAFTGNGSGFVKGTQEFGGDWIANFGDNQVTGMKACRVYLCAKYMGTI